MDVTRRIAAVLGPTLVAVTVSEFVNLNIWLDVHPTVVYLNGLVFLVGGLATVTTHNRWRPDFSLLVTLSGWLLIVAGLYRMVFPNAPQLGPGLATYGLMAALAALGVALVGVALVEPAE